MKCQQLMLKLISIIVIISQQLVTQVKSSNHLDVVSCAMRPDCLIAINEEIVKSITANIHNETDPCENFWDYACGDWTAAPFYDHIDTFGAIGNFYNGQLKDYIESVKEEDEKDIKNLQHKVRNYLEACKQAGGYFLEMSEYLKALPTMPNIDWPNFSAQFESMQWQVDDEKFNWLTAIAELRRYGVNGILLDESIGFAANDSRLYVIELKMPEEDDFQNKYDFINYFIEFGWIEHATEAHMTFAAEIFELETQLRDLRAKHKRRTMTAEGEHTLTLHELKQRIGDIDWQAYFNIILGHKAVETLPIELENLLYMRELAALLEQTDKRTICYYLIMRLCKFLLEVSPQITALNCVEHMQVTMSLGMDYLYSRLYKTRNADERIIGGIFENLKLQFSKYLQQNKLRLTDGEIEYLQEKLTKMQWRLGNLPKISAADYFDNYYSNANVSNNNFFKNHWQLLRHRTQKQHELLRQSVSSTAEDYFVNDDIVQVRNAPYFVHQRNLLIVPFNFVQMPFFHQRLHAIFQQSLMGWILAHEINHGFELDGIVLDANGNESPVGRAIKLKSQYLAAVKCLRRTPTASLIERIADINGFQLAYDAFFAQNHLPTFLTFSARFTTKQVYFLNFAQFFCGKLPQAIDHDRDDVRVITILANMPEFAETFHCSDAVAENPMHKCQMWR